MEKTSEQVIQDVSSVGNKPLENRQVSPSEETFLDDQLEIEIRTEHLVMLRSNNTSRIEYAKKTFWLTISWIGAILIICVIAGFGWKGFKLDNSVLIALITTTTLNVFAFFVLVMKYLFNTSNTATNQKSKSKK